MNDNLDYIAVQRQHRRWTLVLDITVGISLLIGGLAILSVVLHAGGIQ